MNTEITVSSTALIIMISSFSPFILNQVQGQILYPCPNGYQHNSLGLCVPVVSSNPNLLGCPDGYIKSSPGACELVGASSPMLNNITNQTRSLESSLAQRPPNSFDFVWGEMIFCNENSSDCRGTEGDDLIFARSAGNRIFGGEGNDQ